MSNLISTPISPELRVALYGPGLDGLVDALHLNVAQDLDSADVAIFAVSALHGIDSANQEIWQDARELYIPSLIAITDLDKSEIDFDDMAAIAGKTLDPVVTPYLVLHADSGEPAALIDLDTLKVIRYEAGNREISESDPEHKLLVFEFRKEYLEAIEAAGVEAFTAALLFPALPLIDSLGMGYEEIAIFLRQLPMSR